MLYDLCAHYPHICIVALWFAVSSPLNVESFRKQSHSAVNAFKRKIWFSCSGLSGMYDFCCCFGFCFFSIFTITIRTRCDEEHNNNNNNNNKSIERKTLDVCNQFGRLRLQTCELRILYTTKHHTTLNIRFEPIIAWHPRFHLFV